MNESSDSTSLFLTRFSFRQDLLRIVIVALAYFAAQQIAFLFPTFMKNVGASIWPAAGVGLAALLLSPRRLWFALLVTLFVTGLISNWIGDRSLLNSVGFMIANVLESLLCAWLIVWWCGEGVRFTRLKEIAALVAAAAGVNASTALISASTAALVSNAPFGSFWIEWWIGDAFGLLIVAPLIVTWIPFRDFTHQVCLSWVIEMGFFMPLWCAATYLTFQILSDSALFTVRPYMLMALLTYAALRLGPRGVTLALAALTVITVSSPAVRVGPLFWGGSNLTERLLLTQTFLACAAITGLLLAASYAERKAAEQFARRSEAHYRSLFENMLNGLAYCWMDFDQEHPQDFVYLEVNKAFESLTGLKNVAGKKVSEVIPGISETNSELLEKYARVALTGLPERFEVYVEALKMWFFISVYSPEKEYFVAVFDVITERKQAEQALRESAEQYYALTTTTMEGYWMIDLSGHLLDVNEAYCSMSGYRRDELLTMSVSDIEAQETARETRNHIQKLVKTGEDRFETRHRCKDGRVIDVEISATFMPKSAQILAFLRDITERKQTEEQLCRSEASLSKAQQVARVGSWTWNVRTNHLEWSDEMYHIFGVKKEDFSGYLPDVIRQAIHPDDRVKVEQANLSVVSENKPAPLEYRVIWPDQSVHTVWAEAGELIVDEEGCPAFLTGIVQDITERKHAEVERQITLDLLNLINNSQDYHQTLRTVLEYFKTWSNCEAVGIRFRDGEDFPYFETQGFPPRFVEMENRLCMVNATGDAVHDPNGNPVLECMCGSILCGRFDPSKPFYTAHGSFWTNSTTELLKNTTEADRQGRTRNRCNKERYESVALIPLRSGTETFGLVQLNDKRHNMFTRERIAQFERVADNIANAIAKQQARMALQRSEARLQALFEYSPISIWEEDFSAVQIRFDELRAAGVQDMQAYFAAHAEEVAHCASLVRVLDVNQTSVNFFEAASKDEISRSLPTYFAGESLPVFQRELAALANRLTHFESEILVHTSKGELKTLFISLSVMPGYEDSLARVLVSFIDITELRQTEKSLRENEEKLRLFIEHAPASLTMFDHEMRYLAVSHRWMTDYHLGERDIIGHSHYEIFPEIPDRWKEVHRRGLAGEILRTEEDEFVREDGTIHWERWEVRPWYTSENAVGGIVIFSEDITERKHAEEELEQYRYHLEELVEQRTAELKAANEQLLVLSRVKDEFVSNVSHELRTPITNLELRQYLLRKYPEKLDEHLGIIERETDRLKHTIEDLLRLSRLDQGRTEMMFCPIDLNQLVKQVVADRTLPAEQQGLTLSFECQADLPTLIIDKGLAEQVLSILLTNAINYTPAGGKVRVSTSIHQSADKRWAGFRISDTGMGIPPAEQPQLFTRFFRGEVGRMSHVPGTGLGLAIAKEIINRHGGRIEVESDGVSGHGTVFSVWFPIDEKSSDETGNN